MPAPLISNAMGAAGDSSYQHKIPQLSAGIKTSAAVSAKRVVSIGTTGLVATSATDGTPSLCVGVSDRAAASGSVVNVVTCGPIDDVPCSGTVSAGDLLKRNTTTAGWVQATATPVAGEVIGFAINASASNVVDVWVTAGTSKSLS